MFAIHFECADAEQMAQTRSSCAHYFRNLCGLTGQKRPRFFFSFYVVGVKSSRAQKFPFFPYFHARNIITDEKLNFRREGSLIFRTVRLCLPLSFFLLLLFPRFLVSPNK